MDIDLNLNNYTISDLERFFGVTGDYTIHDVEQKKQFMITKLGNMNVSSSIQNDIVLFLNNAKEKLLNNSELIPKQITPFVYSNPSDYFKGTFNPIEKRLVTKLICIDTFFRSSYATTKSTDFTYTFPETINNVVSLQLSSIEIPYTWYIISADQKNNFFVVVINSELYTVTVPDGNYTIDTLIFELQHQLTNMEKGITISAEIPQHLTLSTTPCLTSSAPQQYIKISGSGPFTLNFTTTGPISLGWILGFRNNIKYDGSYYYSGETNYSGETIPMMSTNNYLFVDVDDFHNNHSTDSVISIIRNQQSTPSYIGNNIMARMPITGEYGTILSTTHSIDYISKKREYFGPIKLEKMNIRILNRFGEVINLNQNDYSMVFEITQLYS
jgi:hypothetical protein